ncbi:MAG TPA: VOC family protein [Acidimicrobiales bacterium]|jgi:predicted enzyme related to lactoylglutathione lyase|nr:VOC family protein [Acidimicrobiales bacterium]
MLRFECVCIDSPNPSTLASFWESALGWLRVDDDDEGVALRSPESAGAGRPVPDLLIIKVDDARVVKNRLHFDFRPDDQEREVARLVGLGAQRVDIGQGDEVTWVVLADPEGNEFCVLRATTSSTSS